MTSSMITAEDFLERVMEARAAVAETRRVIPPVQSFLRDYTGDQELRVEIGPNPCTNGKVVKMAPSMELARHPNHDDRLCGNRDSAGEHLCPRCKALENFHIHAYHEMGHITADSFHSITPAEEAEILDRAINERRKIDGWDEGTRATKLHERLKGIKKEADADDRELGYMEAAHVISPWLPMLINSLEDVRVNETIFKAREGLRAQFMRQNHQIFGGGYEAMPGLFVRWDEQETNNQMLIGVFAIASGMPTMKGYLADEVAEALQDEQLVELLSDIPNLPNVQAIYHRCFPVLERIRELGYCHAIDDPENDEPQPGEGDGEGAGEGDSESADGEGAGQGSGSGSGNKESDGDDEEGDGGSDNADQDPDDGDGKGEESKPANPRNKGTGTPEGAKKMLNKVQGHDEMQNDPAGDPTMAMPYDSAIEVACHQGDFDTPSVEVAGTRVFTTPEMTYNTSASGWYEGRYTDPALTPSESMMAPALQALRVAFMENRKGKHDKNLKTGNVNVGVLGQRVKTQDPRLFHKRTRPGKRDYFVCLGLDCSGSTTGRGRMELIKATGGAVGELCRRLGVDFGMYAHSGSYAEAEDGSYLTADYGGYRHHLYENQIYQIKEPGGLWDRAARDRLDQLGPAGANLDGHHLEFYRKVCDASSATDKVILYLTDGDMPCENFHEELAILQREIKTCRQRGYSLVGLGVFNDEPRKHGLDTIQINALSDLPRVIKALQKRLAQ